MQRKSLSRQSIDAYVQPFLAQHNAPGAIVGVSIHGKRQFFSYGAATDDGAPFTPTTLVKTGSCTKVYITTPFALAIARHQIEPDQPAQTVHAQRILSAADRIADHASAVG